MRAALLFIALAGFLAGAAPARALSVQIGNLSDLNIPSWSIGDPAVAAHMDICVYADSISPGSYNVTVKSIGGYKLTSGIHQIPYTLSWDDSSAGNLGSGGTAMTNASLLSNRSNANRSSTSCSGGPTARLNLRIAQADMIAAIGGTYTGTLVFLVSPN